MIHLRLCILFAMKGGVEIISNTQQVSGRNMVEKLM